MIRFANVNSPLGAHEILRTSSPAEALQTMSSYGAKSVQPVRNDHTFYFKVDAVTMNDVVLAHGYHGEGSITTYATNNFFWQAFAINGTCLQSSGEPEMQLDKRHWSALHFPQRIVSSSANEDYQQLTVKIREAAVSRVLGSLIGVDLKDFAIDPKFAQKSPAILQMRRAVFSLAWELNAPLKGYHPAILHELEQSIILQLLLCYRHNYSDQLFIQPSAPSSDQLALAEEYISAHWNEPLEVERIATICGVGARSIFRHFRNRRGCSPSEFIRAIRLQNAHTQLLRGDPQTTVVAVALNCGFASLGHFSKNYRIAYGEKPSATLAKRLNRSPVVDKDPMHLRDKSSGDK